MNTNERYTELIDSYRKEKNFQRQYQEGLRYLLEPYGLSVMEADLLFAICRDPQCDNVTKLCTDIGKTKGVVSRACDHLCKENYLRSENDTADRRVIHFRTTAAVRALITALSRYMESMEYVHRAKNNNCLLSGRLDRKKAAFYLIEERDALQNSYPYLPFCDYQSLLDEKCVPRISPEDRAAFLEKTALPVLEESFRQNERYEFAWQMQFEGSYCPVIFSAEIIEGSHDAALLQIRRA